VGKKENCGRDQGITLGEEAKIWGAKIRMGFISEREGFCDGAQKYLGPIIKESMSGKSLPAQDRLCMRGGLTKPRLANEREKGTGLQVAGRGRTSNKVMSPKTVLSGLWMGRFLHFKRPWERGGGVARILADFFKN